MKKLFIVFVLALMVGAPALHGLSGREFGQAVSGLAKSAPGAVAAHVRM